MPVTNILSRIRLTYKKKLPFHLDCESEPVGIQKFKIHIYASAILYTPTLLSRIYMKELLKTIQKIYFPYTQVTQFHRATRKDLFLII